jgi:hypothetical protein
MKFVIKCSEGIVDKFDVLAPFFHLEKSANVVIGEYLHGIPNLRWIYKFDVSKRSPSWTDEDFFVWTIWRIFEEILSPLSKRFLFVHASCVSFDGYTSYIFVGGTGSGKSITALQLSGKSTYIADDPVLLDFKGNVIAFPRPISLKGRGLEGRGVFLPQNYAKPFSKIPPKKIFFLDGKGEGKIPEGKIPKSLAFFELVKNTPNLDVLGSVGIKVICNVVREAEIYQLIKL